MSPSRVKMQLSFVEQSSVKTLGGSVSLSRTLGLADVGRV